MRSLPLLLALALVAAASGCAREVDPACEAYIACQAAFDDAIGADPVDTSLYTEFGGECWAGDPITRDCCVAECEVSLDAVRVAAEDAGLALDACAVDEEAAS